ncbi:hypothetical protein ACOMHN_051726 [Nucella lapillus]
MGLGVTPPDTDATSYEDTDDLDLEAEFADQTGGEVPVKKSSANKKGQVSLAEMEQMAAQGLQDLDDEVSDTEDPQLLSELAELAKDGSGADLASAKTTPKEILPAESQGYGDSADIKSEKSQFPKDDAQKACLPETNGVDGDDNRTQSTEEAFVLPPGLTEEESKKLFQAPEAPKTVMEALTQRLEKYQRSEDSARQTGDSDKARRMGRIVKQYEKALRDHRAGKAVKFEVLPTPPGFGPIPVDSNPPQQTTPSLQDRSSQAATPTPTPTTKKAVTTTTTFAVVDISASSSLSNSGHQRSDGDADAATTVKPKSSLKRGVSQQECRMDFLQERMEEFRKAALKAKRNGNLETAKQHLRSMKGIEEMIEALKGGQPIDLSQVPPSPPPDTDAEDKHLVVSAEDVVPVRDRDALFAQLGHDLIGQMRMCATNSQHFTKVGDMPAASKFQKLEQSCRQDLESLKTAKNRGDPVPKFHYETRTFSVIQCNTDLGDGEMELTVVRGISLSLPSEFSEKDMDTIVKYEFAFPSDSPQTGQTSAVKSTVNPEYSESFKLQIDRKTRSFARLVEKKGIKLEIYIKRGFLKGDKLLGSATVKLPSLDTKCTLHDSFDLAKGRKSIGGKLEVKVRVREPFKGRQVDQSQEKWLVIDQFIHAVGLKAPVTSTQLEERVAMYLQAIEYATAANDGNRRQALERDIQILMDLMERVSVGQVVPANSVPPPLQVHSHTGEPLANPLGELSSRLADYHKALYYADIEMIGENRSKQIHTLQRGLQVIQKLQEKAQAGFPIGPEDIPPPVAIPTEEEFVVDPKSVITERIALYYQAIELAEAEKKETSVKTLQNGIQKLDYLLKRAETNIPIYKKDLPCSPALGPKFRKQTEQYRTTVELLTKMSGLSTRAAKLARDRGDLEKERQLLHNAKVLTQVLQDYEAGKPLDMSSCPYSLADIERLADEAGVPASQHLQDAETVRLRCNQYKLEALKAKRSGDTNLAVQHMRVVKGLQSLMHAVEKGESVDMTQVPPPPSEQTPTTEEKARILTQVPSDISNHRVRSRPEKTPEPNGETSGMSLAEELSAFLFENAPPAEGSNSFTLHQNQNNNAPRTAPASTSSNNLQPSMMTTQQQHHQRTTPQKSAVLNNTTSSSGLNPLYALTENSPKESDFSGLRSGGGGIQTFPGSRGYVSPAPPVPSRALKPIVSSTGLSCPTLPQRVPLMPVNGFHNGDWESVQEHRFVNVDGDDWEDVYVRMKRPARVKCNGTPKSSSETSCIEILKYEGMQLDKKGSPEAKMAAENLRRQLEEWKQRLRMGGYEAWLGRHL